MAIFFVPSPNRISAQPWLSANINVKSDNIGGVVSSSGSAMPALVGYLGEGTKLGQAIGACAIGSYFLVVIATAFLPETRSKEL